jgi:predicted nucleotide-binding protein (sugar kinase/HSP70/actin superfamily)
MGQESCPVVSGTPRVVYSAFIKEQNLFDKKSVEYIDDSMNMCNKELLKVQLFRTWQKRLKITKDESNWAVDEAFRALRDFDKKSQKRGEEILKLAEQNSQIVILLLGRPYHSDSGLNHEILEEFQSLGFRVITINSIPKNREFLKRYFKDEKILEIGDVWQENFSTNSAQKVWGAKFASRHPNVAVVDLSSFKCGHDAPTYAIIDKILGSSKTPHLTLHDIDANRPSGSIKIRVKTFAYTLEQYRRELVGTETKKEKLESI